MGDMPNRVVFRWQWNWKILLFAALFLPLTLALGFWQLDRAVEKERELAQLEARRTGEPQLLSSLDVDADQNYRPVVATGRFLAGRYFMLANRVRDGQPGYEVLAPFQPDDMQQAVLVNRGWIAGSVDPTDLPPVAEAAGQVSLRGYLYRGSGGGSYSIGDEIWRGE